MSPSLPITSTRQEGEEALMEAYLREASVPPLSASPTFTRSKVCRRRPHRPPLHRPCRRFHSLTDHHLHRHRHHNRNPASLNQNRNNISPISSWLQDSYYSHPNHNPLIAMTPPSSSSSSSSSPSSTYTPQLRHQKQLKQQQQQLRRSSFSSRFLNVIHVALVHLSLLCILSLLCPAVVVLGFNLDSDIPVIKSGPKGSYFGFSVAQHLPSIDGGEGGGGRGGRGRGLAPMMLVGAPKANSTLEKMRDVVRPGALYR